MQKIITFSLRRYHRKLSMIKSAEALKNTFVFRATERCKKAFIGLLVKRICEMMMMMF